MWNKKDCILTIDVGTTGIKAAILDFQGNPISFEYTEISCFYPAPNMVEQDANLIKSVTLSTIKNLLDNDEVDATRIASVSVSAQRCSVIFLGDNREPNLMISWQDNRSSKEVSEISEKITKREYYYSTGLPLCETWILPKLLWVKNNLPEIYKKTSKIVQVHDFILEALGADDYYSDYSDCAFYGFWDTDKTKWNSNYLESFKIDKRRLSTPMPSGTLIGKVTESVSRKTGIVQGTPLCIGVGDDNAACAGTGIIDEEYVCSIIGTAGGMKAFSSVPVRDNKLCCLITNSVSGGWQIEGHSNAAASGYRWFRDEFAVSESLCAKSSEKNVYDVLNEKISKVPVGSRGLLTMPYFAAASSPYFNVNARGCIIGLSLFHNHIDIARSFMEGITLENKDILNSMESMGVNPSVIRATGGATNSDVWTQIQADIFGLPVERLVISDAALLGAAMCAGVGVGVYSSFEVAANSIIKVKDRTEPIAENVHFYSRLYQTYVKTYKSLSENIFDELSELQK